MVFLNDNTMQSAIIAKAAKFTKGRLKIIAKTWQGSLKQKKSDGVGRIGFLGANFTKSLRDWHYFY